MFSGLIRSVLLHTPKKLQNPDHGGHRNDHAADNNSGWAGAAQVPTNKGKIGPTFRAETFAK